MKEQLIKKGAELFVGTYIREVSKSTKGKSAKIIIEFNYPAYLGAADKNTEALIEKLMHQLSMDGTPIRGLKLVWDEWGAGENKNQAQ